MAGATHFARVRKGTLAHILSSRQPLKAQVLLSFFASGLRKRGLLTLNNQTTPRPFCSLSLSEMLLVYFQSNFHAFLWGKNAKGQCKIRGNQRQECHTQQGQPMALEEKGTSVLATCTPNPILSTAELGMPKPTNFNGRKHI